MDDFFIFNLTHKQLKNMRFFIYGYLSTITMSASDDYSFICYII